MPRKSSKSSNPPSKPSRATPAESSSSLSAIQASGATSAQTMSTNPSEALTTSEFNWTLPPTLPSSSGFGARAPLPIVHSAAAVEAGTLIDPNQEQLDFFLKVRNPKTIVFYANKFPHWVWPSVAHPHRRVPRGSPPAGTPSPPPPAVSPNPSATESYTSKRPRGSSSGSSGPSVITESLTGDDNSMELEYATPRANTPVQPSLDEEWAQLFEYLAAAHDVVHTCPDVERLRSLATRLYLKVAPQPQPQRDSVPRNADQAHPKKKVRVEPEPASSIPAPQGAVPIEVDAPAPPPPASKKATSAVVPLPISSKRPSPASTPPVSFASPARKRRRGKHTSHGVSRRGIVLTPPAGSNVMAGSFTLEVINSLNSSLKSDVKSDVILTHAVDGKGIFIAAFRVPSSAEISFILKHVRRLFPSAMPIVQAPITSISYLKMIDIPHVPASSKDWARAQYEAFDKALKVSPVGVSLANLIKHMLQ